MANTKTKTIQKKQDAFLNSKVFRNKKDLLNAILEDGKKYTTKEVNDLLKKELERKVEC